MCECRASNVFCSSQTKGMRRRRAGDALAWRLQQHVKVGEAWRYPSPLGGIRAFAAASAMIWRDIPHQRESLERIGKKLGVAEVRMCPKVLREH